MGREMFVLHSLTPLTPPLPQSDSGTLAIMGLFALMTNHTMMLPPAIMRKQQVGHSRGPGPLSSRGLPCCTQHHLQLSPQLSQPPVLSYRLQQVSSCVLSGGPAMSTSA